MSVIILEGRGFCVTSSLLTTEIILRLLCASEWLHVLCSYQFSISVDFGHFHKRILRIIIWYPVFEVYKMHAYLIAGVSDVIISGGASFSTKIRKDFQNLKSLKSWSNLKCEGWNICNNSISIRPLVQYMHYCTMHLHYLTFTVHDPRKSCKCHGLLCLERASTLCQCHSMTARVVMSLSSHWRRAEIKTQVPNIVGLVMWLAVL